MRKQTGRVKLLKNGKVRKFGVQSPYGFLQLNQIRFLDTHSLKSLGPGGIKRMTAVSELHLVYKGVGQVTTSTN